MAALSVAPRPSVRLSVRPVRHLEIRTDLKYFLPLSIFLITIPYYIKV